MAKNILKNLTVWQNYAHYILLTFAIFGIHYLTDIWGIEALVVNGLWYGWIVLFLFYAFFIFLADTIIHILFAIAPKNIQWSD